MKKNKAQKLPYVTPDSFNDWDNISVARAIQLSLVQSIAQHLGDRENYDPELTDAEIDKFQNYLYKECLTTTEQRRVSFDDFIGEKSGQGKANGQ